jgi:hypothetical protein
VDRVCSWDLWESLRERPRLLELSIPRKVQSSKVMLGKVNDTKRQPEPVPAKAQLLHGPARERSHLLLVLRHRSQAELQSMGSYESMQRC